MIVRWHSGGFIHCARLLATLGLFSWTCAGQTAESVQALRYGVTLFHLCSCKIQQRGAQVLLRGQDPLICGIQGTAGVHGIVPCGHGVRQEPQGGQHTALGAEITDFLQGSESAEQALADVEAAYTAAAKEQGFLK